MKKLQALLIAAVGAFAASAATLSTTSGTTFAGLTAGDAFSASGAAAEGGKYYWYSADAQSGTNMSLAANYYGGACGRPNQFAEAETSIALAVEAENLLYRAAEGSASAFSSSSFTQVDLGDGGLYIDTLIKFEQCRDEADIADDAGKLAVWLNSSSNLVITAGKYSGETFGTNDYVAAALGEVQCGAFNPDAWYRLTVKAVNSNNKVLFNVYIDGQQVTALDGGPITFFPSLQPSTLTLSALAFQGVGAVDDISFTEELPNFLFLGVAQIGDTYYETLADALAAVNYGQTIVLIADPGVNSVTLPKTGIALSDPSGYLSGATVTGPNGQEVTASENTYTLPLTAVNPVTGETENYENAFIGGTAEWNNSANWDTSTTPFITTTYSPALVNGKTASTSTAIDGWTLRVGAYNGAAVTWAGGITKIQAGSAGCWLTADETSSITIASFAGNQLEGSDAYPFKLSSANAGGITWSAGLTSASNTSLPFWYYLKGTGTVVYGGDITVANAQVIKMADVTLSGNEKSVQSKTLVSFTSSTPTFTADAAIKVKNSSDEVVKTVTLATVNSTGSTTLTTDYNVGTCELVQTSTGIVLFWVDGDPSDIKEYKPSININFTDSGNGLTTATDVGLTGYEVPGTSWNNFAGANGTYSTVNAVDATGAASVMSGVSVAVSGSRGSYGCSGLTAASNPLQGYIDENAGNMTPMVTVTGIPYYKYRVIVYHSTDTGSVPFGYDTINGTNYTYVNDALAEGTTAWGNSGAANSADAISEGGNVLLTGELSGTTLTVVGHREGGASNARGCIAAIQIIEVKPDAGENDLIIEVSGATTYTVNEGRTLSGTVYVIGQGTLTLVGSAMISAATIDVGSCVTMNVNADRLTGTTFTGAGTVVYDGVVPPTGKGWTESTWTGTVWMKNQTISSFEGNQYGNAGSTVRFTGVTGFLQSNTYGNKGYVHSVPLELVDEGDTVAFNYNNGWSGYLVKINTLKGSGTLSAGGSGSGEHIYIADGNGFTGVFNLTGKYVYVGGSQPDNLPSANPNGKLEIRAGTTLTVPSGKTWTANGGFVVDGTLNDNGSLSSSASPAISGTGTVVFGGVPSPTGNTWWQDSAWTGTVEIQGVTTLNGNDYVFNNYGNSGSTLKLTNCTGWLKPNYTCVPALEIGGTFTWNDGSSGLNNTFKVATLKGSGTISIPNNGAATAVWQITDDWSGFTGPVVGNNGAAKRILVFGPTLPATITAGDIYISEGATLDLDNSSSAWWGVGMHFVVDGTVKASSRSKWGGGTAMTLGDTGVLEFVSSSNTDDQNTDLSGITGTGTLKFSSSAGWRAYPKVDANMPAATLTIQSEIADSLILPTKNDGETIIGNLAGSKNLRSDWSSNGSNGRILTVTQSKDTEWEGKFVANRTTQFNVVAPAEGTPGTLTLSGTQSLSSYDVKTIPMQVNGSVNLTGTWVGNTTVSGTFGGTGTLTGNLTFSAGSTFKAFASDENGLSVSGSITYPASGTVTVDVSALGASAAKVVLLTAANESDIDLSKFALTDGTDPKCRLAKEGATLVVKRIKKKVLVIVK